MEPEAKSTRKWLFVILMIVVSHYMLFLMDSCELPPNATCARLERIEKALGIRDTKGKLTPGYR